MSLRERAIGFDLDGTLVDSVRDIHDALARALDHHSSLTLAVTRTLVGHGARHLVERALAFTGEATDGPNVDASLQRFRAIYDAAPITHTLPFPGIREVLDALQGAGVAIAVCTNKPAALARVVVDEILPGVIDVVVGPEDAGALKPDPAMLRVAEERLSRPLSAFVGDSPIDAETAKRRGLPFVFVTWGLGAKESVLGGPQVTQVDDAASLRETLESLLRRA
jgi:phosphoglycolate phosphatase